MNDINDKKYDWDIDSLLKGKKLDILFNEFVESNNELIKAFEKWINSLNDFINFHEVSEKNLLISNRINNYVSNKLQTNLIDNEMLAWSQKIEHEQHRVAKIFINFENLAIKNKDLINSYLKNSSLIKYQLEYEELWRYEKHILNEQQQKVVTAISRFSSSFGDIFDVLLDSDMQYQDGINYKKQKVCFKNQTDLYVASKSNDRALRKSAYESHFKAIYDLRNTFSKLLYYEYVKQNELAKLHNFKDYISADAFSDKVDKNFINHIYTQTKKFAKGINRYTKYRTLFLKQQYQLTKVEPWDKNLDIIDKKNMFSIESAKNLTLEALALLGSEYINVVQRAFNEQWISWMPNNNKISGAYSISNTKGLDKIFILMNYDETYNSILTLVHELGHSVHTYFANQSQEVYNEYETFYAEIASITNEILMNYHLLKKYENDDLMRLYILDEMISGFIATTTRQAIFSNFEWVANEWINQGEEFSWNKIVLAYLEINHDYTGYKYNKNKISKYDEANALILINIPHFYTGNFYVYKYVIGQICGLINAIRIFNNKANAKEKYFCFFKSGGSLSPLETINILDIKINENDVWEEVNIIFNSWIDDYIKIIKKFLINKKI
ncbi:oligoendopeptidase F [Ureaplasma parvum]|uniref:Oligopeptidase F n=2 Tax=Ureaplasma parvum serovar 3 TaxID=38504 RepID=Q9PPW8_UREPA|nr:oligoendopeptidase F [Ureaplasma parvum]pir/D82881/ zinc metalloproteinase oligoendopeptidase F UU521 [imported] - Ureaplasma urealyticum [Ureaplasma urealyticum]AAF30934.1 oligoendopeptidase F - zinc metalloprotease [Ureaplasma parvum serovar 3 str. ATCC 700970]ACA33275.1 oligoendopeptidase F [Ureaplasma parvum serovar 3 str. ATCC 27815]EDT87816.1 oligoendopeptidase F [Ureaplasma parvum serovar 14 str. ATCC 33697]EDU19092.1 oligoendopeptidase F [Ureaplasma parvum serovar 6 str. ATCC 27818]